MVFKYQWSNFVAINCLGIIAFRIRWIYLQMLFKLAFHTSATYNAWLINNNCSILSQCGYTQKENRSLTTLPHWMMQISWNIKNVQRMSVMNVMTSIVANNKTGCYQCRRLRFVGFVYKCLKWTSDQSWAVIWRVHGREKHTWNAIKALGTWH